MASAALHVAIIATVCLIATVAAGPAYQGSVACGETVSGDTNTGQHTLGSSSNEHHYSFSINDSLTQVSFNGCEADYDIFLRIFNEDVTTQLAYRDDGGCPAGVSGLRTIITHTMEPGEYTVIVEGFSGRQGMYNLTMVCAPGTTIPPPGPVDQGAITCGETVNGHTASGSNTLGNGSPEHTYTLTLTSPAVVAMNLCQADFDVYARIYQGSTQIAYRDDGGCGSEYHAYRTVLTQRLDAGTYQLIVEGYASNYGNYNLTVSCEYESTTPEPPVQCLPNQFANLTSNSCEVATTCNRVDHMIPEPQCVRLRNWFNTESEISGSGGMSRWSASLFKFVPALDGNPNRVSVESCDNAGRYLTRVRIGPSRSLNVVLLALNGIGVNQFRTQASWIKQVTFLPQVRRDHHTTGTAEPISLKDPDTNNYMAVYRDRLKMRSVTNWYVARQVTFTAIENKPIELTDNFTFHVGFCRGPGYSSPRSNRRYVGYRANLVSAQQACTDTRGCTGLEMRNCRNNNAGVHERYNCRTYLVFQPEPVAYTRNNFGSSVQCWIRQHASADTTAAEEESQNEMPSVDDVDTPEQCDILCAYPNGQHCDHTNNNIYTGSFVALARRTGSVYMNSTTNNCQDSSFQPFRAVPRAYSSCVRNCKSNLQERTRGQRASLFPNGQAQRPVALSGSCVSATGGGVQYSSARRHSNNWITDSACIQWCMSQNDTVACEARRISPLTGCFAFTSSANINHGNGRWNAKCWVISRELSTQNARNTLTPFQQDVIGIQNRGCFQLENVRFGAETRYINWLTARHLPRPALQVNAVGGLDDYMTSSWKLTQSPIFQMGYSTGLSPDNVVVAIESCERPGVFLTNTASYSVIGKEAAGTDFYANYASWILRPGLFPDVHTFENFGQRGKFLHGSGMNLRLARPLWSNREYTKAQEWIFRFDNGAQVETNICQNHNQVLSCGSGYHIQITAASFGRRDNHTCFSRSCPTSDYNADTGTQRCQYMQSYLNDVTIVDGVNMMCYSNQTARIGELCNGESVCIIRSNRQLSDDRSERICPATYKYTNIQYECVANITDANTTAITTNTGPQQYIVTDLTYSSDRSCGNCGNCTFPQRLVAVCSDYVDTLCAPLVLGEEWNSYDAVDQFPIPVRNCLDDQYETEEPTLSSNRVCAECTSCDPGQIIVSECNSTSNRVCVSVGSNYFSNATNIQSPGFPITECLAGSAQYHAPTPMSDRTCVHCELNVSFSSSDHATSCEAVRDRCNPSVAYQTMGPTVTSDRVCSPIRECTNGQQYESQAATELRNRECANLTICNWDHEYIKVRATFDSNRLCENATICGVNEWQRQTHSRYANTDCQPLLDCDFSYQFESQAPTLVRNRQCTNVSSCASTQYIAQNETSTSDRQCATHDSCDPQFQYIYRQASQYHPRICKSARICTQEEYETVALDLTVDRECAPLTTCNFDTQFISQVHNSTRDRSCANLTICTTSQFELVPQTDYSNRNCTDLRECTLQQEYEISAPQYNSNRVCAPLRFCNTTNHLEYEVSPAGPSNNRICETTRTCDVWQEYESASPSYDSNRVCTLLAQCGPSEFISKEHTATTNRVCSLLTQCTSDQYEANPPQNWTAVQATDSIIEMQSYETFDSSAPTQFIRLDIDQSACTAGPGVSVFEFLIFADNVSVSNSTNSTLINVARGQPIRSDSDLTDTALASNANDGSSTSAWTSTTASTHHFLVVDLGNVVSVRRVEVNALAVDTTAGTYTAGICQHRVSRYEGSSSDFDTAVNSTDWVLMATQGSVATVDRICKNLSVCDETNEYEGIAPKRDSDRVCEPLTICNTVGLNSDDTSAATEYIGKRKQTTSDRECKDLTLCTTAQTEALKATDFENRVCVESSQNAEASSSESGSSSSANGATLAIAAGVACVALVALVVVTRKKNNEKPPPNYLAPATGTNPIYSTTYEEMVDGEKIQQGAQYAVIGADGNPRRPNGAPGDYSVSYSQGGFVHTRASASVYDMGTNKEETYGSACATETQVHAMHDSSYDMGGDMYVTTNGGTRAMAYLNDYAVGSNALEQDNSQYDLGEAHSGTDYETTGPLQGYGTVGADDDTYDNHSKNKESAYGVISRSNSYGNALDDNSTLDVGYGDGQHTENIYGM